MEKNYTVEMEITSLKIFCKKIIGNQLDKNDDFMIVSNLYACKQ